MVKRKKTNPLIGTNAEDEADLCRKLTKIFNRNGFKFEFIRTYADLEDDINHILIEVKFGKAKDGAFQLLYGLVKNQKENTQFLGLADSVWLRLFEAPMYGVMAEFVSDEVANIFQSPPSSWSGKKVIEALEFLEKNSPSQKIFSSHKDFKLEDLKKAETWFDANNVIHVYQLFGKYGINMSDFIAAQGDLKVLGMEVFDNRIDVKRRDKTVSVVVKNGPIDIFDKGIIQRMRIKDATNLEDLRHKLDQFRKNRPDDGAYYTEKELSIMCGRKTILLINLDWVGEPMAGAGSIMIPFRDQMYFNGWLNDYHHDTANVLRSEYSKYGYIVTEKDIIEMSEDEIVKLVGNAKNPLFITNPPWSSSRGAAKQINYGDLGDEFGRGNQIYPTIGKIIRVIKKLGRGHLAFFSKFNILCERKSHNKFLNKLVNNFEFVYGSIWSGKGFNDIREEIPVSFTIWKFGGKTELDKIEFELFGQTIVKFKRMKLLKDVWKYNNQKLNTGELVVPRNDYFQCPQIKVLGDYIKNGSEMSQKNVLKSLGLKNIPDELVLGLWCSVVGKNSLGRSSADGYPLHFGGAYTHLPDFTKKETLEILAYSLLYVYIAPNYSGGLIGVVGSKKLLKFGKSKRLNNGAKYLFDTYGNLSIGKQIIKEIIEDLKRDEKKDNWRSDIKKEISNRLDKIGYWDYIPLPRKKKTNPLKP